MYIMIYLLNKNSLPWSDFHEKFKDTSFEFDDFLKERLEMRYTKEVFRIVPKSLRHILKKILTLQFDEEPPYDQLTEQLQKEIQKNVKIGPDM